MFPPELDKGLPRHQQFCRELVSFDFHLGLRFVLDTVRIAVQNLPTPAVKDCVTKLVGDREATPALRQLTEHLNEPVFEVDHTDCPTSQCRCMEKRESFVSNDLFGDVSKQREPIF